MFDFRPIFSLGLLNLTKLDCESVDKNKEELEYSSLTEFHVISGLDFLPGEASLEIGELSDFP